MSFDCGIMDQIICFCIVLGSFYLLGMPMAVGSCAGDNTFLVIEMCSTRGSRERTASNFNIYAAPEGSVQRCDCNLTMIDGGGRVNFTTITLSHNCGGTLKVPGGSTTNCTTTVYEDRFVTGRTYALSFTFSTLDVSKCVTVQADSALMLSTQCTGTSTTNQANSNELVSPNTSASTLTTTSPLTTTRTQLPTTQNSGHTSATSASGALLTVYAVGAGLLTLLVVVAAVTLCYRRVSSVPENITGEEAESGEERPSEEANGQPTTSSVHNDAISALPCLSPHSPTNQRVISGSFTNTNDHLGSETENRAISDNYNTITFESPVHPSQCREPHIRTREKHAHHSYDYLRRTCTGLASSVDGDTRSWPALHNEPHARHVESSDTYNHLRRASQPHLRSSDYDTIASAAKFIDDMHSVYNYDRLKTVMGTSRV